MTLLATGRKASRRVSRATPNQTASLTPEQTALVNEALKSDLQYMDHPSFKHPNAEAELFGQPLDFQLASTSWYHDVVDAGGTDGSSGPRSLLSGKQEVQIFKRFNYARYRLAELAKQYQAEPSAATGREIIAWYKRVSEARDLIAQANLALVLAMAKRMRPSGLDFADMVSEGNMALLRAIDKFDFDRGFKLSTYACRAILKGLSRMSIKRQRQRQLTPVEFDPDMERSNHTEVIHAEQAENALADLNQVMQANAAHLTPVEQRVIAARYGVSIPGQAHAGAALTLEEVGKIVGVTRERVRQIQKVALDKIRRAVFSVTAG